MTDIEVSLDKNGQPVFVEHLLDENPPAQIVHWIKPSVRGQYKSVDGKHWASMVAYHRPATEIKTFPTVEALEEHKRNEALRKQEKQ